MFSERVAQKPTMPVRPGIKKAQRSDVEANREGTFSIAVNPPGTLVIAQASKASAANGRKKALKTSSFRMLSTPSQTTHILISQKTIKQTAGLSKEVSQGRTI